MMPMWFREKRIFRGLFSPDFTLKAGSLGAKCATFGAKNGISRHL